MKGDKVIVRAFGGEPLVRRVWETSLEAVFICSEDNYQTLSSGEDGLWPVGILRGDVFQIEEEIDLENPALWDILTLYE